MRCLENRWLLLADLRVSTSFAYKIPTLAEEIKVHTSNLHVVVSFFFSVNLVKRLVVWKYGLLDSLYNLKRHSKVA